jgi:Ca-activated chloride channel family protein
MAQGSRQAVCFSALLAICASAPAQSILRVDTSLVLIPVHVTTPSGATVTDLNKDDFLLFEDGVQQTITHFAKDDAPVSVGVLLDTSGSMKNKMARASAAATEFFKSANPEDEFFLVEFSGRARLKIPFTHDWREVTREIARAKPFGQTALLDAVHLALTHIKRARNARKAILILSDGGDNFSHRNLRQLRDALMESDAQVYSMGIFDSNDLHKPAEERNGPQLLNEVALETGGQEFTVPGFDALVPASAQIARDLHNQYVLGYSPANPATDGKYHRVRLKLAVPGSEPGLRAYYRRGYYAPGE